MKRFLLGVAVATLCLAASGCYSTVDGRVKGGVPFVKDSIEGRYERSPDQVFDAAREVLTFNGTVEGDNSVTKSLWGRVDKRQVWIKVDEIDLKVSRVVVQARNRGTKDIALAAELEKQIALRLVR
jgi:hypothetical protein